MQPDDQTRARAAHFGAEVVELGAMKIEAEVIATIPRHFAKKSRIIPVSKTGNALTIAVADPSDLTAIDSLTYLLHSEIHLVIASEADIEVALNKYYGEATGDVRS